MSENITPKISIDIIFRYKWFVDTNSYLVVTFCLTSHKESSNIAAMTVVYIQDNTTKQNKNIYTNKSIVVT